MFPNCGAGEDSWESLGLQGDQTNQFSRKSTLNSHWKDWYWSWSSNNLATRCQEPTHWKRRWCWERLRIRGEGGDGGWEGWMTSPTQRTRVWANSWSLACCSPWGGKKSDMTETEQRPLGPEHLGSTDSAATTRSCPGSCYLGHTSFFPETQSDACLLNRRSVDATVLLQILEAMGRE